MQIYPHPFRGTSDPGSERIFAMGVEVRDVGGADAPVLTFIGTDGSEDRHGSIIDPSGWDFASYQKNPLVQLFHDPTTHPIARTESLKRTGDGWAFTWRYLIDAWDDYNGPNLARLSYQIAKARVMMASVGFIPKEWKDRQAETIPSFFAENVEYTKQELTEISQVNVGSDRNALQKALSNGVISENEADALGLGKWFRLIPPIEVRSDPTPAEMSQKGKEPEPPAKRDTPADPPSGTWTPDEELAYYKAMLAEAWAEIDASLPAFENADRGAVRATARDIITSAIYRIDWIRYDMEWAYNSADATRSAELDRKLDGLRKRMQLADNVETWHVQAQLGELQLVDEVETDDDQDLDNLSASILESRTDPAADGELAATRDHPTLATGDPAHQDGDTIYDLLMSQ